MAFTFFATAAITSSLLILEITSSISSTIASISFSFKPRVVIAGVPTRIPEVEKVSGYQKAPYFY